MLPNILLAKRTFTPARRAALSETLKRMQPETFLTRSQRISPRERVSLKARRGGQGSIPDLCGKWFEAYS